MTNKIFATYAPLYFEKGFSVIPAIGKRPLVKSWSKYCEELPSRDEFEDWVKKYPHANISLCMGSASGIIGLDFDENIKGEHDKILKIIPESTLKKVGKKGFTLFYKFCGEVSKSYSIEGTASLDILSSKRACVLPPSIHPETGEPYRWEDCDILNFDIGRLPCLT